MVGKRKRDTSVVSRSTKAEAQEDTTPTTTDTNNSQDLFRKFFEAQFQPLDIPGGQAAQEPESEEEEEEDESEAEESDDGSDWDGVSDEDETEVEVVEHQDSAVKADGLFDKKARKAFMSSKLPSFSLETTTTKATPSKKQKVEDDGIDADDLKNDLALQRLLKESHLLESASELDPTGKNRHKALDLRMQSLGSSSSLYKQKMPSAHRKGIKAKAEKKEDRRRLEAKENGIILEKPTNKSKPSSAGRRERSVGGPSIGKFAGGTLNLSKRDLSSMSTPRPSSRGRGRGGRGGGRGRGNTRGRR